MICFGGKKIILGEEEKMHPYIKEKGHLLGKSYKSQPGSWHGSNSKKPHFTEKG